MMKTNSLLLFCFGVFLLKPLPAGAQLDTDNATSAGTWFWAEVTNRSDNDPGIRVDADHRTKFSYHDCRADVSFDIRVRLSEQLIHSTRTLYLYMGDQCDQSSRLSDCVKIGQLTPSTETVVFQRISLSTLFPETDCAVQANATARLWFALLDTEDVLNIINGDLIEKGPDVRLDTIGPPVTVTLRRILSGNENLTVEWSAVTHTDVYGYVAVYAASDDHCETGVLQSGSTIESAPYDGIVVRFAESITSLRLTNLTNETAYEVAVATLDEAGNTSVLSEALCAAPMETVGFGQALDTDGDYCFVATAAFGSSAHPSVNALRVFRDGFLRRLPFGDNLISGYYQVGPTLGNQVQNRPELRNGVITVLSLFSGGSALLVRVGPAWVTGGLLLSLLLGLLLGWVLPSPRRYR